MKPQDFFAGHPVFTHEEFAAFLSARGSRNRKTRESILSHYIKTERILRVRRGLYLSITLGLSPEQCPVDPYLLAAKMAPDAVLAYHTALELHGKAYSVFEEFVFLTCSRTRPLSFRGQRYRGVAFPSKLAEKGRMSLGTMSVERSGLEIRVTSLERTLVDLLDRPSLGGTWEEIWRSLETVEFFDLDEVVEYSMSLENATTAAKVGFFLDQHRDTLMPDEAHLDRLRLLKPAQPHYMSRADGKTGRLVRDWNLIVPAEIVERRWEEFL